MELMRIKDLRKKYYGKEALRGIDMTIHSGGIVGLLGPNASGKTTLMKTIAGLLQPDGGEITYPGGVPRGVQSKKTVSFLPDHMEFPSWMKVSDAFAYHQAIYPDYNPQKAAQLMDLLELPGRSPIRQLSKGMQERVSLGLVFSRDASLFLLDEPLGGIDPVGKLKVLDSILSMPLENAAIVLSTHLVKDVETIFDSFFLISEGKIIFDGNSEQIREEQGKTVEQIYLEVFINAGSN